MISLKGYSSNHDRSTTSNLNRATYPARAWRSPCCTRSHGHICLDVLVVLGITPRCLGCMVSCSLAKTIEEMSVQLGLSPFGSILLHIDPFC